MKRFRQVAKWFKCWNTARLPSKVRRSAALKLPTLSPLETLESRVVLFAASGNAWPAAQLITISFMPDGTDLGGGKSSNLQSTFNTKFGTAATWQNQILKAAQFWAQQTNINFSVVSDNGGAEGSGTNQQGDPNFGDIRIGGYNFGTSTLAQAFLPPPVNNYSIAGDIQFNTGATFNVGSTYDLFTVSTHEIGHALGLLHSTTTSAVMYSTYSAVISSLNADDISGIKSVYSAGAVRTPDAQEANETTAAAKTVTINSTTKAAVVNSLDLTTSTDLDYFKFTVPTGSATTLKAKVVATGLSLLDPKVEILNSAGTSIANASVTNGYGGTVTATYSGITAGQTYYVKISSVDALAAFKTGKYALVLNMGTGADPAVTYTSTAKPNGSPLTSGGGQAFVLNMVDTATNTTTADAQQTSINGHQNVAIDKSGNFVATWASNLQDGSGWGIFAQRYNAAGVAQGSEFRVNTTTAGDQTDPSIAMDHNGNFVITWTSAAQDGSGLGIYAQRFNSSGVTQGSEFKVNTTTVGDQSDASVASSKSGSFVVTWTSANQDGSGLGVYGQLYNSTTGLPVGVEFKVNTTTVGDQSDASIGMDWAGNFVIGWTSAGQDGSGKGIFAQHYTLAGVALGSEFKVNTTTAGDQQNPTVVMDQYGNFGIVWASLGQDAASSWGIYGQRYLDTGTAQGTESRINTTTAGDQTNPVAIVDSNGNSLVTWTSNGQDGSGKGIYGQIISASDGSKVDGEFRLNNTTIGDQQNSSVAVSALGQAVVIWTGNDATSTGVFTARLDLTKDAYEVAASDSTSNADDVTLPIASNPATVESQQHRQDVVPGSGAVGGTSHEHSVSPLRMPHFASPSSTDATVITQRHATRKPTTGADHEDRAASVAIDSLFASEAWLTGRHYRNR